MIEFRIAENRRKFYIEHLDGKFWRLYEEPHVPRFFDSLADARSWVATIKRGVVYHDAEYADEGLQWFLNRIGKKITRDGHPTSFEIMDEEHAKTAYRVSKQMGYAYVDAPNLAQSERKAEDDTSDGVKPLEWFLERVGKNIRLKGGNLYLITSKENAYRWHDTQFTEGHEDVFRYSDPR